MEWYWWFLELSANLVEASMIVLFIQQFSEPRYKRNIWPFSISVIAIFGMMTALNFTYKSSWAFVIISSLVLGVATAFLAYRGSVISRFLLPVIITASILVMDVLSLGILQLVFREAYIVFVETTPMRMLGIIISKVLLISSVYYAGRLAPKAKVSSMPLGYGLCLLLVPAISIICIIALGQYMMKPSIVDLSPIWFALSASGMLFLNLLIIYLFQAIVTYSQSQNRLQLMVQQSDMLNKHLRETNALQDETHKIWHDMKNHFTVIQWMVKQKSYDKLENYMDTLNETVASAMPKYQTGNHVLDALLNTKSMEAKKNGIEFIVNASVPQVLSIDDLDLNIVISNALDNAIEACWKLPESRERYVGIDATIKNDHLFLTVKNPFTGEIRFSGGKPASTKADAGRHGIGVGNMMRAVEKYDGHIHTDYHDGLFVLTATMHCTYSM